MFKGSSIPLSRRSAAINLSTVVHDPRGKDYFPGFVRVRVLAQMASAQECDRDVAAEDGEHLQGLDLLAEGFSDFLGGRARESPLVEEREHLTDEFLVVL